MSSHNVGTEPKGQRLSPPRFIHHAAEHFLGREPQLALLDEAWTNGANVLSIIAWGGVGKTALITEWVQTRFIEKNWETDDGQPALDAYFDWTFYDQGTRSLADGTEARTGSVGDFFEQALVFFGDPDPNLPGKGRRLADLVRQQRSLIILAGLEPLQQPPGHPQAGRLLDPDLRDLLAALAQSNPGLCLISSRQALTDLHALRRTVHTEHELEDLPVAIAIHLLRQLQIKGTDQELAEASEKFGCHALSLTLRGRYFFDAHGGDISRTDRIRDLQRADTLTREDRDRPRRRQSQNARRPPPHRHLRPHRHRRLPRRPPRRTHHHLCDTADDQWKAPLEQQQDWFTTTALASTMTPTPSTTKHSITSMA